MVYSASCDAKRSSRWCKRHHTGMIFVFWKSYILKTWLLTSKTFWDYINNGLMKQIPKDSFWVDFSFSRSNETQLDYSLGTSTLSLSRLTAVITAPLATASTASASTRTQLRPLHYFRWGVTEGGCIGFQSVMRVNTHLNVIIMWRYCEMC